MPQDPNQLVLDPDFLVRNQNVSPIQILREDLEDTLKEYGGLDLIVEVLQNALDAIDERRYKLICDAAGRSPSDNETIEDWNAAVLSCIRDDYEKYSECSGPSDRSVFYREAMKDAERRKSWWETLASKLGGEAEGLRKAASSFDPELTVIVRPESPAWIEVLDNGVGMLDVPACFRHKTSDKRSSANRKRRLGIRGSHGWGLSAILGMSNRIEVLSNVQGGTPHAYSFSNYGSFVNGAVNEPENQEIELDDPSKVPHLSQSLLSGKYASGTHIRIQAAQLSDTDLLGYSIENYTPQRFSNLLRMYTPIGQVNNYVLNPAYHNIRRKDLSVSLRSHSSDEVEEESVRFDIFRFSETDRIATQNYDEFVNDGMKSNRSVHTIHRSRRGGSIYLSGAEIQGASLAHEIEEELQGNEGIPAHIDENGNLNEEIPRGFRLALSGGMASEYLVRKPRSTSAAFRGYILSETAKPTLGRKYVMDQRKTIPRAAGSHESSYDEERKRVLPKAVSPSTSLKSFWWRVEYFESVIENLRNKQPLSKGIQVWAEEHSREALVMLTFASLLENNAFGNFYILRAHLQDRYDFAFLYRTAVGSPGSPKSPRVEQLDKDGYAKWDKQNNEMFRYGVGEFKYAGEKVFDDFNPNDPKKSAAAIDLLVCWKFDKDVVEDQGWTTANCDENALEFQGQTHVWRPQGEFQGRSRPLPVIQLGSLLKSLVDQGDLDGAPEPWPDILPDFKSTLSS